MEKDVVDKRFALIAGNGDVLYPYKKHQKSTGRYGFALTSPGTQDRKGGGDYTLSIEDVVKRMVFDGWNARVKTTTKPKLQREGSLGIGKLAIVGYWISDELKHLVKGAKVQPTSLPDDVSGRGKSVEQNLSAPSKLWVEVSAETGKNYPPPSIENAGHHSLISADAQSSLEADTRSLKTAEREAVVKIRCGQGSFREALIREGGEQCWMTGIEGRRLLFASHIKPWSQCEADTDDRGCQDNGLLLSPLWDVAFDAGLVSYDSDWSVVVSAELSESARASLGLNQPMHLPQKFRTDLRKTYLSYHRTKVFEFWKMKGALETIVGSDAASEDA